MKLLVAKSAGFCFGVKRAMDMALEAAKKYPKDLYTLGPLIHNPQAVKFLEGLGVKVKSRLENIPRGTVIFRSHGVSLRDLKKAREKKLHIIDATCPIVKKAQYFAKERFPGDIKWHFNLYGINENNEEILFTKDHIIPKSKGGGEHIDNFQTMCCKCNSKKGNKLEEEEFT